MPIDESTDPATATDRRTFLARSVVGGALVTAGAVGAYGVVTSSAASAETIPTDATLTQAVYAAIAASLELAAVQAYQAAIDTAVLSEDQTVQARSFQDHHQQVATVLGAMLGADAAAPTANAELTKTWTSAISAAGDQNGQLKALSNVEDELSATHLTAIGIIQDGSFAKTVGQVAAVEGQQSAILAVAAGGTVQEVTPAKAPTDGGYDLQKAADALPTTTTTTAAN